MVNSSQILIMMSEIKKVRIILGVNLVTCSYTFLIL